MADRDEGAELLLLEVLGGVVIRVVHLVDRLHLARVDGGLSTVNLDDDA